MAPTHDAAKLMSLSSLKLVGKMREDKIRKDEKRKCQFMILMKVAQKRKKLLSAALLLILFFGKSDHFFDPTSTNLPPFAAKYRLVGYGVD